MKFSGEKVTKETKHEEVINYDKIFNDYLEPTSLTKLRQFLPMYYGREENEEND